MQENNKTYYDRLVDKVHNFKPTAMFKFIVGPLIIITGIWASFRTIWPPQPAPTKEVSSKENDSNKSNIPSKGVGTPDKPSKKDKIPFYLSKKIFITGVLTDDSTKEFIDRVAVSAIDGFGTTITSKTDNAGYFKLALSYPRSTQKTPINITYTKLGYEPLSPAETINFGNQDSIIHPTKISLHKSN